MKYSSCSGCTAPPLCSYIDVQGVCVVTAAEVNEILRHTCLMNAYQNLHITLGFAILSSDFPQLFTTV